MSSALETILVLDFGSQYTQLIARRIREANVYSEVVPFNTSVETIRQHEPRGIVLSGGPDSVYEDGAPACDPRVYELGIPILGVCYGMQLMAKDLGGKIEKTVGKIFGSKRLVAKGRSNELEGRAEVKSAKTRERVKGKAEEAVGSVEAAVGDLIDSPKRQARGEVRKAKGKARQQANRR